jgi:phage gp16-like protein
MTNSPAAWNALRAKVQHATRNLDDDELVIRTVLQQRRWKRTNSRASWDVLQELHTEQHRRRWA